MTSATDATALKAAETSAVRGGLMSAVMLCPHLNYSPHRPLPLHPPYLLLPFLAPIRPHPIPIVVSASDAAMKMTEIDPRGSNIHPKAAVTRGRAITLVEMPRVQRNQHPKRQPLILMRSIAVGSSRKPSEVAGAIVIVIVTRTASEIGGDESDLATQKIAPVLLRYETSPAPATTSARLVCMVPAWCKNPNRSIGMA